MNCKFFFLGQHLLSNFLANLNFLNGIKRGLWTNMIKLLGFLFVTPQFVSSSRIRFTYVTCSKDKTKTLKQLPAKCFYEIKKSRLILQNRQGKKCLYPSIFFISPLERQIGSTKMLPKRLERGVDHLKC